MKKFALQMLMIVMAFAISQASWADNKGKDFGRRPHVERRHMHRPFGQKMDSAKVHRHITKEEFKDMMDSLKVANPRLAHRIMHHRFARRHFAHRHFPRHHFPHRPGWKKHELANDTTAKAATPSEVKAADATAIRDVKEVTNAATYDLNGRPVEGQNGRGIVIRNGKKFVK